MARRKQAQPRHWENSQDLADNLQNGIPSPEADGSDDEHVCGKCRAEFATLAKFLQHKQQCISKRPVLLTSPGEPEGDGDALLSPVGKDFYDDPRVLRLEGGNDNMDDGHCLKSDSRMLTSAGFLEGQLPDTNVVIEELRNTTVAVAQRGQDAHLDDMIALQKAVYSIQQQQMFNFQAIQAIHAYILGTPMSSKTVPLVGTAALTPPQSSDGVVGSVAAPNGSQPSAPTSARTSISNRLESSGGGPPREPNTLELLKKHTERALQNTMVGGSFLLNGFGNKSDGTRLKKSKEGKLDGSPRHGCRFCGKVFGSDSGLQIHVRSHTGERPFKCSVCSSCFSTRGNLKVHFQRHTAEYANLKQNGKEDPYSALNGRDYPEGALHQSEEQRVKPQYDQALDFSTSVQTSTKPHDMTHVRPSRSPSPNDMSNSTDDSQDGSTDERMNFYGDPNDDEDDDGDSSVMNDNGAEDGEMASAYRQNSTVNNTQSPYTPSPSFSSFFRPVSFNGSLSENPSCLPSSSDETPKSEGFSIAADPTFYQDLLPRIGSNDNSWENLMEVTKTSETYKLQQLVDNIETKVSDPNQCIVCQRVLSCKSALQMHYRTHTGERPFKCKICSRAFTTKGNLKTHMSVHRLKPPMRILHQCPVCHKQFSNALILQQHVRMHTGEAHPDSLLYANDDKPPTMLPPAFPRLMPPPNLAPLEPLALTYPTAAKSSQDQSLNASETVIRKTSSEGVPPQSMFLSSPSASITSSDAPTPQPEEAGVEQKPLNQVDDQPISEILSDDKSYASERSSPVNMATDCCPSSPVKEESPKILTSPTCENPLSARSLSPKSTPEDKLIASKGNLAQVASDDGDEKKTKGVAFTTKDSVVNRVENSTTSVSGSRGFPTPSQPDRSSLPFSLPYSERPLLPTSASSSISDFTPSLAALENQVNGIKINHPLPFPSPFGMGITVGSYLRHESAPTLVKREKTSAYSSPIKNNSEGSADERSPSSVTQRESPSSAHSMPRPHENVALDLTPKTTTAQRGGIADLPMFTPLAGMPFLQTPQRTCTTCRVCYKTFACQSALEIHYRSHTKERPFKCDVCDRGFSTRGNMKQHMLTHKIRDLPSELFTQVPASNATPTHTTPTPPTAPTPPPKPPVIKSSPKRSPEDLSSKRPMIDAISGQPIPKRPAGLPKHLCHVCNKPFSSGSALQIHMRTHTGDKPFQCTVCTRAFTTKGNLKVHMGTHMWNNSTSRRGRRMSLDLAAPLSLPGPKPGDYPAPRHDLYFPYLPAFMNGMTPPPHMPPKMNEISVIQTAGIHNGNPVPISTMASSMIPPLSLVTSSRLTHVTAPKTSMDPSSALEANSEDLSQKDKSPPKSKSQNSSVVSMGWPWKIACSACSKICVSSTELELHMKTAHLQQQDLAECPDSDKPST